jgi:hypothetical protein
MIPIKFNKGQDRRPSSDLSFKLNKEQVVASIIAPTECPPCPPASCVTAIIRVRLKFQFETNTPVEWIGEFVSWDGYSVTLDFGASSPIIAYQYPAGYEFPDEVFMTFSAVIEGIFCNPPCNLEYFTCQGLDSGISQYTRWFLDGGSYGPQSTFQTSTVFSLSTSVGASSLPFLQFIKISPLLRDGINEYSFPTMGVTLSEAPP